MWLRAIALWLAFMLIAIANGALRELVLVELLGQRKAQMVGTAALAVIILLAALLTVGWLKARGRLSHWLVGLFWVALSIAFEFLFGHYVLGESWEALIAAYRIDQGSPWPVFLVVLLVAPYLAAALRGRL
jgi:hypothetical protein